VCFVCLHFLSYPLIPPASSCTQVVFSSENLHELHILIKHIACSTQINILHRENQENDVQYFAGERDDDKNVAVICSPARKLRNFVT
jgi:hypothetical protein